MEEEWKDFPGFEEKYQISNLGRVKRKETMLKNSVGVYCHKNEKILKTQIMKIGYPSIVLRDDSGKKHLIKIHRAVAMAFIPNPRGFPFVNHIDGNKGNSTVSNLEWCDPKWNAQHAVKTGLKPKVCGRNIQRIYKLNVNDLSVECIYENFAEASRENGNKSVGSIYSAVENRREYKGFYWIREKDFLGGVNKTYFRKLKTRFYFHETSDICNEEIRIQIKENGLRNYEVANKIGVSDRTLCEWLKKELGTEKENMILSAIKELKK